MRGVGEDAEAGDGGVTRIMVEICIGIRAIGLLWYITIILGLKTNKGSVRI
jgi:hypothetical protein